jgi:hypothetical protein
VAAFVVWRVHEDRQQRLVSWVLAAPDRVEAFRITPKGGIIYSTTPDRASAAELRAFLADPRNYPAPKSQDDAHTCVPQPGIAVHFRRGESHVEATFCFECCELWLVPTGGGYFCERRAELARIMHKIFPRERAFD